MGVDLLRRPARAFACEHGRHERAAVIAGTLRNGGIAGLVVFSLSSLACGMASSAGLLFTRGGGIFPARFAR